MAKSAKTAIKTKDQKAAAEAKNWTKVVRAVRSPKTGAYTFKEAIVHKDKIKEFLAQKQVPYLKRAEKAVTLIPRRLLSFLRIL